MHFLPSKYKCPLILLETKGQSFRGTTLIHIRQNPYVHLKICNGISRLLLLVFTKGTPRRVGSLPCCLAPSGSSLKGIGSYYSFSTFVLSFQLCIFYPLQREMSRLLCLSFTYFNIKIAVTSSGFYQLHHSVISVTFTSPASGTIFMEILSPG